MSSLEHKNFYEKGSHVLPTTFPNSFPTKFNIKADDMNIAPSLEGTMSPVVVSLADYSRPGVFQL